MIDPFGREIKKKCIVCEKEFWGFVNSKYCFKCKKTFRNKTTKHISAIGLVDCTVCGRRILSRKETKCSNCRLPACLVCGQKVTHGSAKYCYSCKDKRIMDERNRRHLLKAKSKYQEGI